MAKPTNVPLTDAEKKALREQAHVLFMGNLNNVRRNPYAYGGRGSGTASTTAWRGLRLRVKGSSGTW